MKKLFLGICYLFVSHAVLSQQIRGRVTEASNGTAVAAATVESGNSATLTNDSGYFVIRNTKQTVVRVSSLGFRSTEQTVTSGSGNIEIRLERINLMMQPVEVRAIRAGEKAPFTKTNITKRDIEKLNYAQDLPTILNQTPSVVINSDAGNGVGYTGLRIRG